MASTEETLNNLKEDHDFEKLTTKQYEYVTMRLQKDVLASQLRS